MIAALSVEEVLAPWRREMLLEAATYLIAVALLLVLGAGSYRYQRRTAAAETTIRISEARHRLLTENSRDMISIKPTFGGDRSYVSPASRNVVGWEPEEFAKLACYGFHPSRRFRRRHDTLCHDEARQRRDHGHLPGSP